MSKTRRVVLLGALLLAPGCSRENRTPEEQESKQHDAGLQDLVEQDQALQLLDELVTPGHLIRRYQLEQLAALGLSDPISQIVDSLRAHPEVIPFDGILGGTMGFYYPDRIHVLSPSWVYAEFDDGHISGRGVFAYSVQADTSFLWTVVTATLR